MKKLITITLLSILSFNAAAEGRMVCNTDTYDGSYQCRWVHGN